MRLLLTGTPGVGKHTVTRMFAEMSPSVTFDLNEVARDNGLIEEDGAVDIPKLSQIMNENINKNTESPCVITGHLAPYVMSPDQVTRVIVMRRDPYELLEVYRRRGYSRQKSMENAGSEILDVIYHDSVQKFGDLVKQLTVTNYAETMRKAFTALIGDHDEKVDWLKMIRKNGDLEKFFEHGKMPQS